MISSGAQFVLDALEEEQAPAVRARLFQWASLRWFEMQPIFYRASHLCVCDSCGKIYLVHPEDKQHRWLHKLCNGDLVKL